MGSRGLRDDEEPEHRVFVSGFEMAATPVTREDYEIYLQSTGAEPPPSWNDPAFSRPRQPIVGANWPEATAYCLWLSQETGLEFRLPTEAEREKAARGGRVGLQFPGAMTRLAEDILALTGRSTDPTTSRSRRPTATGFSTWRTVCTNGVSTATIRDSTKRRRKRIPAPHQRPFGVPPAAGRGDTNV